MPELSGSVATIGSFDGIHRGHQALIRACNNASKDLDLPSVLITFDPHPQQLLRGSLERPIRLLSGIDERAYLVSKYAPVDMMLVLDFNRGFSGMSADEFAQEVLEDGLAVKHMVVGYDHRFGHQREGDAVWLKDRGLKKGYEVTVVGPVNNEDVPVSSTLIRDHIESDRLDLANAMLGHAYTLFGKVVKGKQRGQTLSFPTANIEPNLVNKLVPNRGVYLTRVSTDQFASFGMCNIGIRPTFKDGEETTIEANLFHVPEGEENLYGKKVTLEFLQKLRDEKKFSSVDDLIEQLENDKKTCIAIIENYRDV
ncbi:MAG: riboflavin biosynthesis protein RibF [Candidatus Marinimicrobia bacterium]|nr:riboflavin biosynthesis protein RibF [Candidatus Neomarinimicrobiota bacterium]MCF7905140.1 riboflavin biosynthesis protein RibF [Candidatus Neomarinimicrobiota bacterium]